MNYKGKAHKVGEHIDTDAIIPARFLVTTDAKKLGENCMSGLEPEWVKRVAPGDILVAGRNFGCGSSREHAPWVLECNGINIVIAENFARIFRQNMFNCGLMAISLDRAAIDEIFKTFAGTDAELTTDIENRTFTISNGAVTKVYPFTVGEFDLELVKAGGWVNYADSKY